MTQRSLLQVHEKRVKLNTLITFPVSGLDMSHHVIEHKVSHQLNQNTHWSPWRRSKHQQNGHRDNMYDLYAVCNHYGNMQGGHYTGMDKVLCYHFIYVC